jgi:hypothetical protein
MLSTASSGEPSAVAPDQAGRATVDVEEPSPTAASARVTPTIEPRTLSPTPVVEVIPLSPTPTAPVDSTALPTVLPTRAVVGSPGGQFEPGNSGNSGSASEPPPQFLVQWRYASKLKLDESSPIIVEVSLVAEPDAEAGAGAPVPAGGASTTAGGSNTAVRTERYEPPPAYEVRGLTAELLAPAFVVAPDRRIETTLEAGEPAVLRWVIAPTREGAQNLAIDLQWSLASSDESLPERHRSFALPELAIEVRKSGFGLDIEEMFSYSVGIAGLVLGAAPFIIPRLQRWQRRTYNPWRGGRP